MSLAISLGRPALVVAASLVLLVGCGGSSAPAPVQSPPSTVEQVLPPASGQVSPVVLGLTFGEYNADGQLLQVSLPADAQGVFTFEREFTGVRVASISSPDDRRVPDEWSALIVAPRRVDVTPLSSVQEQLVRDESDVGAANESLSKLVRSACGPEASRAVELFLFDPVHQQAPPEWLQRSLAAYVRAIKDVGIQVDPTWKHELFQHRPMLASMCQMAQQVEDSAWLAALGVRVPAVDKLSAADKQTLLSLLRPRTVDEMLRLIGTSVAVREYPELSSLFEAQISTWRNQELEVSLRLAESLSGPGLELLAAKAADAGATAASAAAGEPMLDRSGQVVQALVSDLPAADAAQSSWYIHNSLGADQSLPLSINGVPLFDRESLVSEMLRMPKARVDEGLHQRAWRFMAKWRTGAVPMTGGRFQHQVDLYLRSIGSGRCDDDAATLRELWSLLGFNARVWGVGGHVVPEVWVNGRWEMYDLHFGVYYLTHDRQVAGVEELQRDPSLVGAPVDPIDASGRAYAADMVEVYGDPQDNEVLDWYSQDPVQRMGPDLTVPAGGIVEVVVGTTYAFPSLRWSDPNASVPTAQIRLWFPPGYSGAPIDLPLILADATGSGRLTAIGKTFTVTADGIRPQLQDFYDSVPDTGVTRVVVSDVGPEGLTLTLLLNSRYFPPMASQSIQLTATDLSGLQLEAGPRTTPQ